MNLLLDTHIFIWAAIAPDKLSQQVRQVLQDPANTILVSVVTAWEMQIKAQIGRLSLPMPVKEFVTVQRAINNMQILPVRESHIWVLDELPLHHRDPFDRLLIAQAINEKCQLVTADPAFENYPVTLITVQ